MGQEKNTILQVSNLKTYFYTSRGVIKAVDDVSFSVEKGKVFGVVGESGSGKTLTALSILKLVSSPGRILDGQVIFSPSAGRGINGIDLLKADEDLLRSVRGSKISFVFQEPASSFNPVFTIGEQIVEAILAHEKIGRVTAEERALEYLKKARINDPERIFYSYPHQLSGGTKQRAMISMALINSPELIILDEPTTALDVTIQAQILDMLDEIIHKENLSILFISHDFGVVARMCDSVAVMNKGKIVESGDVNNILNNPKESYTISLLESVKALS
jgi:ABC-type dipeptide/oligopeptide/nickel transport system ATPase component